jgi:hypothetical protein
MVGARILAVCVVMAAAVLPAAANPFLIEAPQPEYTSTFALRYWYGMGETKGTLYDFSGSTMYSRLTYDGMKSHAAEVFFRVDGTESSLFFKGYAGGGLLAHGNLQDEDFPPAISPYSSTNSSLQNQGLGYLSIDVGGALLRGADFRIDGFVGYHWLNENMKAFGCTQTATNTSVCTPSVSDSTAVIQQQNNWQSLRLGLNADLPISDRFRINLDAAWLPYVWFKGQDTHYLRINTGNVGDFSGPIPEDGHGWGYQLEAVLTYKFDNNFELGVGWRYWHMQSNGYAHFENVIIGANGGSQVMDWKTDRYGIFLQGSYKFSM